jgi:hypothetical protein
MEINSIRAIVDCLWVVCGHKLTTHEYVGSASPRVCFMQECVAHRGKKGGRGEPTRVK